MKKAILGGIINWKGHLARVISRTTEPHTWVGLEFLEDNRCPNCGERIGKYQFDVIEDSPLFQENAKAVDSLEV